MGYESRLYIADYHERTNFMEVIASFDLCKLYIDGWRELFKTPITNDVWFGIGDSVTQDMYGEVIKYADIEDVAKFLEDNCRDLKYRRIEPCISLLRSFDKSEWGDLKVLHYGH